MAFGATQQQAFASKPKKHPCPWPRFGEYRADELVAGYAKCSIMNARQLPPLDYYEMLFIASAIEIAKPQAEQYQAKKAERKARPQELAEQALKRMPLSGPPLES